MAALFAVPCAEFALLLADKIANRSKAIEAIVYQAGKWIPGATGTGPGGSIGPYSGKEIIALAAWLLSWVILHSFLRDTSPNITKSIKIFLIAMLLITLNFIDPIADVTFAFVNWIPK
ncbi:hypothetical protein WS67_18155 [Burkholderia singularis]|uniref:Uncharacterized protein n=1 Tax=Burkholderia singularis TaxID=1503053 RepID=A0A103DZX6_9BURK|nr:hypothetical protein AQ611_03125 [Burkholderia sp. Bp7605]KVE25615.1 hypothetical protein WS67_18155 [Burkholderia singularis]